MAHSSFQVVRTATRRLFKEHLLLVNTVSCGVLLGAGDIAVQSIERISDFQSKTQGRNHDWARTGRMCIMGVVMGPFNHYWYTFLDKVLPGKTTSMVVRKIVADQLVASPFFLSTFFMGSGTLEGQPIHKSWEEFRAKFWTIYKVDWSVWPAAQAINFYLLPPHLRVIYVAMVTFGWNTFLCYMKHKDSLDTKTTIPHELHVQETHQMEVHADTMVSTVIQTIQNKHLHEKIHLQSPTPKAVPAQVHTSASSFIT